MSEKLVVFLCRCIDNISGKVEIDRLRAELEGDTDVNQVVVHDLLCGPEGQQIVTQTMADSGASRAIIAACSIRDHEHTFQKCLAAAGCNRFALAMTNIREHCSWVTDDPEQATKKALALTRAALARARMLEPLKEKSIDVSPDVLVVGAGIAGVEAALLAAQAGRKVTLIEKTPSIGGRAVRIEDISPNLECMPCMVAPRFSALTEEHSITLMTQAEVTKVVGFLGNFRVTVSRRARWVDELNCLGMGCDECINACPVTVKDDHNYGLSQRKAVYLTFPGAVPNAMVIDRQSCLRARGENCTSCAEACPMEAIDFNQTDDEVELQVGAIVVATGFDPHIPEIAKKFGYGNPEIPDVYTFAEFERLISSDGPTRGHLKLANGARPKRIAVIHCVGRSQLGYCSGICCSSALKLGILVNKHGGRKIEVVHVYHDLMIRGSEDKALADRAVEKAGSKLRAVSSIDDIEVTRSDGKTILSLPDGRRKPKTLKADMIVLLTGLVPRNDAATLAEKLQCQLGDAGFIAPDHQFLRALQTSVDGIFMAGCVTGPKNVFESITQAQGAAGVALARIQPGRKLELESTVAEIVDDLCSGCLTCIPVCPYQANAVNDETGRVTTNEVLCKGCGTCVAACPSGAASARHFTDNQLLAELREVLCD